MTTVEMENVRNMPHRENLQMVEMLWEDPSRFWRFPHEI